MHVEIFFSNKFSRYEHDNTENDPNSLPFDSIARNELEGILGYEDRPLVSTDYTNDSRSVIIDGPSTMVINGTQVKVFGWYDNEWGYACRMVDIIRMMLN